MIHRDTPPPVIQGVTYRTIQTNSRPYVEKLDKEGKNVYVWKDERGKTWVAYPEVVEITKKGITE